MPPSQCLEFDHPNLAEDSAARSAIKDETVAVTFAEQDGELASAVGINRYRLGDAILTGSTGDRWSVSRDRFDAKYEPQTPTLPGRPGSYRNRPVPVLAMRVDQAFTVSRSAGGDVLRGNAGDWLIQYAPGDYGIVDKARFERVYRLMLPTEPRCGPG
jgi:PGDYG protein